MQRTVITIATIAAACIGIVAIDEITIKGKKVAINNVKQKIVDNRSDSDKEMLNTFNDVQKKLSALERLEESEINKQINDYKEKINYISRKQEIIDQSLKTVDEFKESIGYDEVKLLYKQEFDEALNTWKKENNFEDRISSEKAKITEAEKVSQNQNLITKFTPNDSEYAKTATEKLLETINETKDKAIKDANSNIKSIEKEFDDYRKTAKKELDSKINDLTNKVNAVREEASKKSTADIKALETDVSKEAKKIREKCLADESEEMVALRRDNTLYEDLVRQLNENEEQALKDSVSLITSEDIIASYFSSVKIGKTGAFIFLLIPTIPIIFTEAKLINFAINVTKKMEV